VLILFENAEDCGMLPAEEAGPDQPVSEVCPTLFADPVHPACVLMLGDNLQTTLHACHVVQVQRQAARCNGCLCARVQPACTRVPAIMQAYAAKVLLLVGYLWQ